MDLSLCDDVDFKPRRPWTSIDEARLERAKQKLRDLQAVLALSGEESVEAIAAKTRRTAKWVIEAQRVLFLRNRRMSASALRRLNHGREYSQGKAA